MSTANRISGQVAGYANEEWLAWLRLCLIEARPVVAVMFALRYLTAAVMAGGVDRATLVRVLVGVAVWELAVLGVYILNGTMDVAEDRINSSRRPIASGRLSVPTARRVAVASAVIAVAGGLALDETSGCLVAAFLLVGFLYSAPPLRAKRHATTSALTGVLLTLLTYCAAYTAAEARIVSRASMTFCLMMALWTGVVGSITKDIPDVVGDTAAGRRTIVAKVGEPCARVLACVAALAIAIAFAAVAAFAARPVLAPAVVVFSGALLVTTVTAMMLPDDGPGRRRWPYRAFMLTQYAAHLCMLSILI